MPRFLRSPPAYQPNRHVPDDGHLVPTDGRRCLFPKDVAHVGIFAEHKVRILDHHKQYLSITWRFEGHEGKGLLSPVPHAAPHACAKCTDVQLEVLCSGLSV